MGTEIIYSGFTGHRIEYNNYIFNSKTKVQIALRPNYDSSGRIIISHTYTIRVSGFITPRFPIPGDKANLGIQAPTYYNIQTSSTGLDPNDVFATTDSEIRLLRCLLSQNGKTLRVTGIGNGDIYVNTVNPNTGNFVQDLDFGPKTSLIQLRPVGFNKAWYIDWQVSTVVMHCCGNEGSSKLDFNKVANRIQEYNFEVSYDKNEDGYITRTISGILRIIPPIFRNNVILLDPMQGPGLDKTAAVIPALPEGAVTTGVYNNKAQLLPPQSNKNALIKSKVALFPSINSTAAAVAAAENGNVNQLYETVDQYWDYVENSIPVPFGFKRVSVQRKISTDKRTLRFSIQDKEKPPFSLPKNYSNFTGSHTTQTHGQYLAYNVWTSNLSATFRFPKFVYSSPTRNYTQNSVVQQAPIRRSPRKDEAFLDFNKIVFQRFAYGLLGTNGGETEQVLNPKTDKKEDAYAIWPVGMRIAEKLDDLEIGFSIDYHIVCPVAKIFKYTGHGLPVIIAADPKVDPALWQAIIQPVDTTKPDSPERKALLDKRTAFAKAIQLGGYTDAYSWYAWRDSMIYGPLNTRGSANIWLDRTSDFIRNLCTATSGLPTQITADPATAGNPFNTSTIGTTPSSSGTFSLDIEVVGKQFKTELATAAMPYGENFNNIFDRGASLLNKALAGIFTGQTFTINVTDPVVNKDESYGAEGLQKIGKTVTVKNSKTGNSLPPADITSPVDIGSFVNSLYGSIPDQVDVLYSQIVLSEDDADFLADLGYPENNTLPGALSNAAVPFSAIVAADNITQDGFSSPAITDSPDTMITNVVMDSSATPPPENSWIAYESAVRNLTESQLIRHKYLPKRSFAPHSDTHVKGTEIQNKFSAFVNTGPDELMGEDVQSNYWYQNPPISDIIQQFGSPSQTVVLEGFALRAAYPISPPTLLRYGGKRAYQRYRDVSQKLVGQANNAVYYCKWSIVYELTNIPAGILPVPDNPIFSARIDKFMETTDSPAHDFAIIVDTSPPPDRAGPPIQP